MKRALWLLPLLLLLACGSSPSTFPSADAPVNTAVPAPADSNEAESETPTEPAVESDNTASDAPPAAGLAEFAPAATVEEAAQVRSQDWYKGAEEPAVAIIEYGDFQ